MTGPFLYDDGPEALHTGTPRRSGKLLVLIFGATVLVAVLMVVALPLVKGSGEEQARQVTGVFLAALQKGDTETAHDLLCDEERGRLAQDQVAAAYLVGSGGRVVGDQEAKVAGKPVQKVRVAWNDGSTSTFTVVPEGGSRVCGIS